MNKNSWITQCSYGKQVYYVCFNKICKYNPFICKQNCQCETNHIQCEKFNWNIIGEKLSKNILNRTEEFKKVTKQLDQMYQKITKHIQKSYQQYKLWKQKFGLTELQQSFQNLIISKQLHLITSSQIQQIVRQIKLSSKIQKNKKFPTQIQSTLQQIIKKLQQYYLNIKVSKLSYQLTPQLALLQKQTKSQIQLMQSISKFFDKKIKYLNLIYKASQNNFQVSEFWNKCQGKINTIAIIQNQYGKKIGGFNSLAWAKNSGYLEDLKKQTFIFSITQGHKFSVVKSQQKFMVYNHGDYGPIFGGTDLIICNNADKISNSYGRIGNTYEHGDYIYDDGKSWRKFSGNENGCNFKIVQWSVFMIIFEQ